MFFKVRNSFNRNIIFNNKIIHKNIRKPQHGNFKRSLITEFNNFSWCRQQFRIFRVFGNHYNITTKGNLVDHTTMIITIIESEKSNQEISVGWY